MCSATVQLDFVSSEAMLVYNSTNENVDLHISISSAK